ncbi:DHA2 family efflux MFS transporter permease subunit [Herbaspirillum sp. RTI4]|uniref:DHA2 family efflux MFS transporter permease subunit n=1 Tax=Herbaspirillum sp. RTI4 TaxID=3048640 RepID=UPI002AB490B8|nr:DHA2 family efflux MFS transporter permease subunit [Herbaspirillum sp. RTI4]MDY7579818.1 DHA2 family efflux MFS transporter permease subunit [Herbaspirillum sp. RTI4]MEA9981905.1 DHA2 family efflux MFS transporter permease subunit [Herbaspirillum sp. RTI4]
MVVPRTLLIPLIVACALFMEQMDSTVISTSLPALAVDMAVDPIALKLALTSYLLSLAVFIPISGWMADRFGSRTIFRAAIAVFMLGSILCGISHSLPQFVLARFFQGIGGAMMVPVGRLVVLRSVDKANLVRALSYLTIPAMLGPVMGPVLGGFITTYFHWRWIFFINMPIGILGLYLATRFIPQIRAEQSAPLDWVGFCWSALGCSALMMGMATVGRHLVSTDISLACIALGIVGLLFYVRHARRCSNPLIDLALLKIETLRAGVLGGSLFRIGIGAIPFLLPLMLQLGFGYSAFQSGLLTCFSAAGAMFMKTVAVKFLQRFGFRTVLMVNGSIAVFSFIAIGAFDSSMPYALMAGILLIGGCLRSLQFTSLNAISYADVTQRDLSQATSIASVAQQLSVGMGVTLGGLALQLSMAVQGHTTLVTADFWPAFLVVGIMAATSIPLLIRLPRDAGAELSGRGKTRPG